jgi:cytochrome b561
MSSAAGIPVKFLELFTLPDLMGRDDLWFQRLIAIHQALAWALIALFAIHAGAALRHHFAFRDDTLRRMLP